MGEALRSWVKVCFHPFFPWCVSRCIESNLCTLSHSPSSILWSLLGTARAMTQTPDKLYETSLIKSQIRVVSFDLDNTIWNTTETIQAANDALAKFLDARNIAQPIRVEKVMGELFQADKARYSPIERDTAKAPVALTLLRKDAIRKVLCEYNNFTVDDASLLADEAFDEWALARHEAMPENFASSVCECLQEIASLRSSDGLRILIGAITDGNSDPSRVKGLEGFDFCVNAESVGVSKPDKRLFLKGVEMALNHPLMSDFVSPLGESLSDDILEESIGPFWVHVGDDFVKDIVAAKSLRMRTIWSRELVRQRIPGVKPDNNANSRSVEQFVKEISGMKVVKMEVGAADYLADSLQQEFADAAVDHFRDLGKVVSRWHEEGLSAAKNCQ